MGHTENLKKKKSVCLLKLINPMEIEANAMTFLQMLLNMIENHHLENISL